MWLKIPWIVYLTCVAKSMLHVHSVGLRTRNARAAYQHAHVYTGVIMCVGDDAIMQSGHWIHQLCRSKPLVRVY